MRSAAFVTAAVLWAAGAVQAGTICRWVDETGRTQISDTVPERFRAKATCTDSAQYELTPAQKAEAEARAARERAAMVRAAPAPAAAASAASAAAPARPARPVPTLDDRTDCNTWRRVYAESQDCFGPFRTVHGGIKPEAFQHCETVPAPPLRCTPLAR